MSLNVKTSALIYGLLVAASAAVLAIQHFTHFEFLYHLAALPLEVLVAVFVVGIFIDSREKKERRMQLMHIKSCMFRLEMRNLFIANFMALQFPAITVSAIRQAPLAELKKMREDAKTVEYKSSEAIEGVIMEYVAAEPVWRYFMNIALEYDFEDIFQDMLFILHFIGDVKSFKDRNPEKLFIAEAASDEKMMGKVMNILGDGIRKFLDYTIELKEKKPDLLNVILSDYELSTQVMTQQAGSPAAQASVLESTIDWGKAVPGQNS